MADPEVKTETRPTPIEFGTFEVKAVNDDGAEVRLTDEKSGSNLVLRLKSANKQLSIGQKGALVFNAEEPPVAETVTVEMPADEMAGLTPNAKVVDKGAKKAATK